MFYGGAAGGGKTDLLIGLALTEHSESVVYRREATQLKGIYKRIGKIIGNRDGFSQMNRTWNYNNKSIEFGSCPHLGDEESYQGQPHDLVGFDEITHFLESQFRFLIGWNRTEIEGQRCRVVCTGNPPTTSDGDWVIKFWGPWLDKNHPNPAKPGELRWFATIKGEDVELENGDEIEVDGETVQPRSRTFIPSSVQDNPYLMATGYESVLQGLPEPLRSQMLKGDFTAGKDDDPFQVIPSEWVELAMARWKEKEQKGPMDSVGVDPARGGRDQTIIARRHGAWFDKLLEYPGSSTPDGPIVSGLVIAQLRDGAPVHVDIIGVGSSVYDHLKQNHIHTIAMNGAEKSEAYDQSQKLRFVNKRAEWYWKFREALDPKNDYGICLPDDSGLKADLCAPRWKLTVRGIQVESKDDIVKRLGRSPDKGDAVVYCYKSTPKLEQETGRYHAKRAKGSAWAS